MNEWAKPIQHHLAGGGEMGRLIRSMDWSSNPLGPIGTWPQSLLSAVSILLPSKAQIALFWGPELITLYNDAYRPVFGGKHPQALGRPIREAWSELWRAGLKELFENVLATGEAFWAKDHPFYMERHGFLEETFFDVSYDPVRDESGRVGGVFCIVSETTGRVLHERRLKVLRDLGTVSAEAHSAEDALKLSEGVLASALLDVPFVNIDLDDRTEWPIGLHKLAALGDCVASAPGPWPEPAHEVLVLPLAERSGDREGKIALGVSSRLVFDDSYRDFFQLVARQVAASIAAARASEAERKRAEALAEIDRAKTMFFSNVSHEFRTPLTLMLGPLQDALANSNLPQDERERLDVAHRNSIRLLKLVNSLLDFARIEAGRAQASYERLDLAALTAELASNFRSACERAGLSLIVDCPPLPDAVYVDRDMWEKIVLNLLSNAFKFTFAGEIGVRLRAVDGRAELSVWDTGVGVPEHELPRLFERFHRIEGQKSRTFEGSGIGLALVQELVRLNGATIDVKSRVGEGTTFTIAVPFGTTHLPQELIGARRIMSSTSIQAGAFVEEVLRWLPDGERVGEEQSIDDVSVLPQSCEHARVLVADDNADMRGYVRGLLDARYEVATVADGQAALEAIRERRPDLVLADVMMPRLDGFGLLRAIRDDPDLRDIQVIMLSARAGEESRLEGLAAGADDYLLKPFTRRELIARVESSLKLARVRAESSLELRAREERYRDLVEQTPDGIFLANADGRYIDVNQAGCDMLGMTRREVLDSVFTDVVVPEQHHRLAPEIARFDDGCIVRSQWLMRRKDGTVFEAEIVGRRLPNGNLQGIVRDVTEDRRREEALRESEERFRMLADNMNQLAWTCEKLGDATWYNQRWLDYTGLSFEDMKDWGWKKVHHPDHIDRVVASVTRARETGEPWEDTFPLRGKNGEYRWFLSRAVPIRNDEGEIVRWLGTNTDITEQRKAEETQRLLTSELSHRVKNMLATVQAIASQTLRRNSNPAQFVTSFGGRIQSMARIHSMLSSSDWQGADLREIIRDQLTLGAVDEDKVIARGPVVRIEPQMAPQVGMMLHELGTNSIKYGALSRADGIVTVDWSVNDDTLCLRWVERGGPRISAPVSRGFGSTLIMQSAKGVGGTASMTVGADGVQWEISLPLPRPNAAQGGAAPSSEIGLGNPTHWRDETSNVSAPTPVLAGKCFLVVEDEPLVALEIVANLEQAGVRVVGPAGTASEALAMIERAKLDAALLDANLHGQHVGDIAAALTRLNVPFVFVTGYGRESLPQAFTRTAILAKPFNQPQLLEAAAKLVQKPAGVLKLRG